MSSRVASLVVLTALAACAPAAGDGPMGIAPDETLLSVSASGDAESRPDTARFEAGVDSFAASARAASDANAERVRAVIGALRGAGVAERDIQTRALTVGRVDYGDREGQYNARNVVAVTVREVEATGEAVTAATEAGANVVSGPSLSMDDGEASVNDAYAGAFRAARARADAYAEAAGMEVARVIRIRDGGGWQGGRMIPMATVEAAEESGPVAPPPPQSAAPFQAGTTASSVSVQVDFALRPR